VVGPLISVSSREAASTPGTPPDLPVANPDVSYCDEREPLCGGSSNDLSRPQISHVPIIIPRDKTVKVDAGDVQELAAALAWWPRHCNSSLASFPLESLLKHSFSIERFCLLQPLCWFAVLQSAASPTVLTH